MEPRHKSLATPRFALEPLSLDDAALIADLGADPDVVKTLVFDWSEPEGRLEIARYWIELDQAFGIWGVFDRDGAFGPPGGFLGFCATEPPLPLGGLGPEIYYAFKQQAWGRGLATEAVGAVIAHLFRDQGVVAVEALVLPGLNLASNRLLEKLGMGLVGRYPFAAYLGEECEPTIRYELWRVETAAPDRAHQHLRDAAFKIGQFVADGVVSKEEMTAALIEAAAACGLTSRIGVPGASETIDEFLNDGMAETGWLHYRMGSDDLR